MKAPWAPIVAAAIAGGGWGGVREKGVAPSASPGESQEGDTSADTMPGVRLPARPAGKGLARVMKQLARLKSRGARPRRLRRLATRAQTLLDAYKRREDAWQDARAALIAEADAIEKVLDGEGLGGWIGETP